MQRNSLRRQDSIGIVWDGEVGRGLDRQGRNGLEPNRQAESGTEEQEWKKYFLMLGVLD